MRQALTEVVRPVSFTAAGLALGVATLARCALTSQANFGLFASLALGAAWVLEFAFTRPWA